MDPRPPSRGDRRRPGRRGGGRLQPHLPGRALPQRCRSRHRPRSSLDGHVRHGVHALPARLAARAAPRIESGPEGTPRGPRTLVPILLLPGPSPGLDPVGGSLPLLFRMTRRHQYPPVGGTVGYSPGPTWHAPVSMRFVRPPLGTTPHDGWEVAGVLGIAVAAAAVLTIVDVRRIVLPVVGRWQAVHFLFQSPEEACPQARRCRGRQYRSASRTSSWRVPVARPCSGTGCTGRTRRSRPTSGRPSRRPNGWRCAGRSCGSRRTRWWWAGSNRDSSRTRRRGCR